MFEIIDGWLTKDGEKVNAEHVMIEREHEAGRAYFHNPESIRNLATIDMFLYQCMITHSTMRERKS